MNIFKTYIISALFFLCFCNGLNAQGTPPSGTGASNNPYLIASLDNLIWVSNNSAYWGKYFEQTADINASSTNPGGFNPMGNSDTPFTGSYDGKGHTISGLYISRGNYNCGLFGYTGSSASIKNLGVINVNVCAVQVSNGNGGLVGFNNGNVSNCYTSGLVYFSGNALPLGGLVGYCAGGSITNCYSFCEIKMNNNDVGGIIGELRSGTVSYCYFAGKFTFIGAIPRYSGSIVGNNSGNVSNCFWDDTKAHYNGCGNNSGTFSAQGKSTDDMKKEATYTGWDFENTWEMIGTNYPRLKSVSDPALPVELTSFSAAQTDGAIKLTWVTATEVNNHGFEVEKAVPSSEFGVMNYETIGFVAGAGNSNYINEYSFTDNNVKYGKYSYRLKQIDNDGQYKYSNTAEVNLSSDLPAEYVLQQNYPNPFNPETNITFRIRDFGFVSLKVYDMLGKEITTLVNETKQPGEYNIRFNGSNLASGIYTYQLRCENFTATKKLMLIK